MVTDPHFNTLLVHEVVGHPSELDRALKYETAYAGRSWFLKNLQENQIGEQIASPMVSTYSDPLMEGYGSFNYDHEGTPARRAYIIRTVCWKSSLTTAKPRPSWVPSPTARPRLPKPIWCR